MQSFNYHRPSSISEAQTLLNDSEDGVYLAGGHTLLPSMKLRLASPTDVIDLASIAELTGIGKDDAGINIGALSCHCDVAGSSVVRESIPALADLATSIGDPQVRNRGTLGGSVANSDPAADYPAAVLALGASIHTDSRVISADDFFTGMFETALNDGELITRINFPLPAKAAYSKFPNPASRYAIVGVFVAAFDSGVRVAVTGAALSVFRLSAAEQALTSDLTSAALSGITVDSSEMNNDMHASAEYRAHLVMVMLRRAVEAL